MTARLIDVEGYLASHGMAGLAKLDRPLLLTFNPQVWGQFRDRFSDRARAVEPIHGGRFFDCTVGDQPIRVFCSGDGGPAAAFATEIVAARRAPFVIGVGQAASIMPERLTAGELFVPQAVIRGDGVSRAYLPEALPVLQNYAALAKAHSVFEAHGGCVGGLACSVDSYFAVDEAIVETWQAVGGMTLDMEAAGFLTVCRLRNQPALLVQVASATIRDRVWVADHEQARRGLARFMDSLPELLDRFSAVRLGGHGPGPGRPEPRQSPESSAPRISNRTGP